MMGNIDLKPRLTRPAVLNWLATAGLLAAQAVVLRFLRWQAIEDAKRFESSDLAFLAAHRDLVKAVLFITIALALLLFKEIRTPSARKQLSAHQVQAPALLFNALSFGLLATLIWALPSPAVDAWLAGSLWGVPLIYTLLAVGWLVLVTSAFALLLPMRWVVEVLRENRLGAVVVLLGAGAYVLSQSYLTEFESVWSRALLPPTVYVATQFSALIGIGAVAKPGTTYFGTETFIVDIGPTCLGYQGVSIVLALLTTYILTSRERLRTGRSLLVLPAAIAVMLLFNALRISILVAIGTAWSPEIAVMGFHSTAGWVELMLTLIVSILVLGNHRFFQKAMYTNEVGEATPSSRVELLLVPQVVLIGVSFITQMFTGEFYWLYPAHITAAAIALWILRKNFPSPKLGAPILATVTGICVFGLWLALVPADPEKAGTFARNLYISSPAAIAVWLLARAIGTSLVVPLVEELAFRGFLLREIQRLCGRSLPPHFALGIGLVTSSIIFGVLHSAWIAGSIAGVAYGAVYLHRNRLYDAVLAHSITNFLLAIYAITFERWSYL